MLPRLKVAVRRGRTHDQWSWRFGTCVTFAAQCGLVAVLREALDRAGPELLLADADPQERKAIEEFWRLAPRGDRPRHAYSVADLELFEEVKGEWHEYVAGGTVPVEELMYEQFLETAVKPLENVLFRFVPFDNVYDLNFFLAERDTIEFFLVGLGEWGWEVQEYEALVARTNSQLRHTLGAQAAVMDETLGADEELDQFLNQPLYPARFFWRHWDWSAKLRGED